MRQAFGAGPVTGRDRDIERAQRIVRERFGEGRSPSEELIRERREEAAREEREFAESRIRRDVRELRGRVGLRPGYDHKRLRRELNEGEDTVQEP